MCLYWLHFVTSSPLKLRLTKAKSKSKIRIYIDDYDDVAGEG